MDGLDGVGGLLHGVHGEHAHAEHLGDERENLLRATGMKTKES